MRRPIIKANFILSSSGKIRLVHILPLAGVYSRPLLRPHLGSNFDSTGTAIFATIIVANVANRSGDPRREQRRASDDLTRPTPRSQIPAGCAAALGTVKNRPRGWSHATALR